MVDPKVTGPPMTLLTRTLELAVQGSLSGLAARTRRHVRQMPTANLSNNIPATNA